MLNNVPFFNWRRCSTCANAIKTKLLKDPRILGVIVNLSEGYVQVQRNLQHSTPVDLKGVSVQIDDLGFDVVASQSWMSCPNDSSTDGGEADVRDSIKTAVEPAATKLDVVGLCGWTPLFIYYVIVFSLVFPIQLVPYVCAACICSHRACSLR